MLNSHEPFATGLHHHALTEPASPPIDRLLADLHQVVIDSQSDSLGSAKSTGLLYRVSSLTLVAGWLATVLTSIGFYPKLAPWALTVLLYGIVSTVGLGAPSWIRAIREWKSLEADTVAAVGRNLARWHNTILQIRATYTHCGFNRSMQQHDGIVLPVYRSLVSCADVR